MDFVADHIEFIGGRAYCIVCGEEIEPKKACDYGCCRSYRCQCEGSKMYDQTQNKLKLLRIEAEIERLTREKERLEGRIRDTRVSGH